jgi:hypothetical protein
LAKKRWKPQYVPLGPNLRKSSTYRYVLASVNKQTQSLHEELDKEEEGGWFDIQVTKTYSMTGGYYEQKGRKFSICKLPLGHQENHCDRNQRNILGDIHFFNPKIKTRLRIKPFASVRSHKTISLYIHSVVNIPLQFF